MQQLVERRVSCYNCCAHPFRVCSTFVRVFLAPPINVWELNHTVKQEEEDGWRLSCIA